MCRRKIFLLLLAIVMALTFPAWADSYTNMKSHVELLKSQIARKQAPELYVELAILYLKDQQPEKAFRIFLDGLERVPALQDAPLLNEETLFYEKALALYLLGAAGQDPREMAKELKEQYGAIAKAHPEYYHLNMLLACAYANLGDFEEFFKQFYKSYQKLPKSFLAFRTKAILHIKLYERASTLQEKELEKNFVFENLKSASAKNPQDVSLYRMMIAFLPEKDKDKMTEEIILGLIKNNIIIPRSDIPFYVTKAVDIKKSNLAQMFLNKAREWYSYSQTIEKAQMYIDLESSKKGG